MPGLTKSYEGVRHDTRRKETGTDPYAEESTGNPVPAQSCTVVAAGQKYGVRTDPHRGAAVTTVDNHIRAGKLKAMHTQDGLRIPKAWLVEFMCGYGYAIRAKSQRHCEMLGRYFEGME